MPQKAFGLRKRDFFKYLTKIYELQKKLYRTLFEWFLYYNMTLPQNAAIIFVCFESNTGGLNVNLFAILCGKPSS